jgi:hypothetical protein
MTSSQQARVQFPNAVIVGGGGDGWCVVNRCWPSCRITFFESEAEAREAVATAPCSTMKCLGKEHHEVRRFKPTELCWERD